MHLLYCCTQYYVYTQYTHGLFFLFFKKERCFYELWTVFFFFFFFFFFFLPWTCVLTVFTLEWRKWILRALEVFILLTGNFWWFCRSLYERSTQCLHILDYNSLILRVHYTHCVWHHNRYVFFSSSFWSCPANFLPALCSTFPLLLSYSLSRCWFSSVACY